jgi:ADP-ribosylglycohydrolase
MEKAKEFYEKEETFKFELKYYELISSKKLLKLKNEDIKSNGYVVDTILAAPWTLITTNSYKECILKAVNLGLDTDTVAVVAGGLAGIYYGLDNIPDKWKNKIVKREYVEYICNKFSLLFEDK